VPLPAPNLVSSTFSLAAKSFQTIKEKLCYIDDGSHIPEEKCFECPDGSLINLGSQRVECTEALFYLQKNGFPCNGFKIPGIHIPEIIVKSVDQCEKLERSGLLKNIVVSGGSSLFKGMEERLNKEINKLVSGADEVKVNVASESPYLAWRGASVLASFYNHDGTGWISREKYLEFGAQVVSQSIFR